MKPGAGGGANGLPSHGSLSRLGSGMEVREVRACRACPCLSYSPFLLFFSISSSPSNLSLSRTAAGHGGGQPPPSLPLAGASRRRPIAAAISQNQGSPARATPWPHHRSLHRATAATPRRPHGSFAVRHLFVIRLFFPWTSKRACAMHVFI